MSGPIKILLVEDEDLFRTTVKRSLLKLPCEVTEASNGKVAKEAMMLQTFHLVISDIQMPHFTGVDLLEWVKKNHPATPVVLMTGFSQALETKRAHELGAAGFLAKPFRESDLNEIIEMYLQKNVQPAPEPADLDQQFCKISIDGFLAEKEAEVEIHIRLSSTKYIKIAHAGGKISEDRVRTYKEKGVQYVYVKKEDFAKIVKFNLEIAKLAKGSSRIDPDKKIRFMHHAGELILEHVFINGVDPESFRESKDFLDASLGVLTEDSQIFSVLNILSTHADFLYAHSLGVSVFSVMIGREIGWTSASTLFKLALGGLFHDVGKKEIPREVLERPRPLLTQKERALVESHVTRGKEILEALRSMPSDVVIIADHHHEDCIGQGYPHGLSRNEIHPLARVVQVANIFCEYAVKHRPDEVPLSGSAAIATMEKLRAGSLDKEAFAALKKIFKK